MPDTPIGFGQFKCTRKVEKQRYGNMLGFNYAT